MLIREIELESTQHDTQLSALAKPLPNCTADAEKGQPGKVEVTEHKSRFGRFKDRYKGWRHGLLLGFIASVVVFFVNLGFALWAVQHHRLQDSQGVLYEGDCKKVERSGVGLHFVINIFGTTLLGASNYCMLKRPMCRYNSTIFTTISADAYNIFAGSGSFTEMDLSSLALGTGDGNIKQAFERLHQKAQNGTLYRLDNSACIDAYATAYQSAYGSVLVVTTDITQSSKYIVVDQQEVYNPSLENNPGANPYRWLCADLQTTRYSYAQCLTLLPQVRSLAADNKWTVSGHHVDYCLVETVPSHCKLQYSLPLVVTVISLNLLKAILMGYMAFWFVDTPILTMGDAVASFLRTPNQFSESKCLLIMDSARNPKKCGNGDLIFDGSLRRWRSAIPRSRWILGIGFYVVAILACVAVLAVGLILPFNNSGIWKIGLGEVSAQSLLSSGQAWITSLVVNAILANLPQLILSMLYFTSNSLLTSMLMADEWSRYALRHKGLRVSSHPRGSQRSKYFLSLPYRYAIPLMISLTLLHWLISQSLFLVMIQAYSATLQRDPANDITTCGYSPTAIVSTTAVGVVMFCCLIFLSRKRFKTGMPVAGSCSISIAAACHPHPQLENRETTGLQEDEGCLPVRWGSIQVPDGEIGHCSFSSGEVELPEQGKAYR
ncbi:uncharacterized protein BP5553_02685 [Venustampulla echinocandica]|uniref:DUF6536 domain-containing protein n=1 Tax=Venustampulla echinocandica TaxID=2656787 RepID=A0A370TS40_9HELO|nr:uncharacterized protein BP5553_02685 [Venustampulla echinocandica]RDL38345.1 hypothetical protein BP5553_02685 [Venustampulla echinocandica]